MNVSQFSSSGITKSPLGIIALFLILVYSIAGLLLGYTTNDITDGQRWPLIVFVCVFPLIVLGVFVYLVKDHHNKLFGPSDYKSDEAFLTLASSSSHKFVMTPKADDVIDSPLNESPQSEQSAPSGGEDMKSQEGGSNNFAKDKPKTLIRGEDFINTTVVLDGKEFRNCNFKNVILIYRATGGVGLAHCKFFDVRWTFEGAAADTVSFLQAIHSGLGEDGEKLIKDTFKLG